MSVDLIRYDLLVQDALRGVVGRVLTDVARDGLPGEHHLYLSFDTRAAGVRISPRLKERYPEEMTIVLQHQFWDLIVTDQFFEVGLSFNGIPERLHVPYAALKGFFDPSVKFGLQFESVEEEGAGDTPAEPAAPTPIGEGRLTSVPSTREPTRATEPSAKLETAGGAAKPAAVAPTIASSAGSSSGDGARVDAKPATPTSSDPAPSDTTSSDDTGAASAPGGEPTEGGSGGAQVVRLDAFRKK